MNLSYWIRYGWYRLTWRIIPAPSTPAQSGQALADELWRHPNPTPVFEPIDQVLLRQRDDALQQLNDRANIGKAILDLEKFAEAVEDVRQRLERAEDVGVRMRALSDLLLDTVAKWKQEKDGDAS